MHPPRIFCATIRVSMPDFHVHRLKDPQRQNFRWAPHTSGLTIVKPNHYEKREVVHAASPYAAWEQLRQSGQPLEVGDLLEIGEGELRICKYIGFEEARWFIPEAPAPAEPAGHAVT